MKHIYLFNNTSNAAEYGIGTYIRQIVECLKENDTLKLTIVELETVEKELKVETGESTKIRNIQFPKVQYFQNEQNKKRYYRNLVYLLTPYISELEENIFHFNYIHQAPLSKLFKERWLNSNTVLTIHYLDWSFALKGNTTRFHEIICKEEAKQNDIEKRIYKAHKEEKQAMQDFDKIICLSKYTQKLLVEEYEVSDNNINVIYNGLDSHVELLEQEERAKNKESLFLEKDEKIILYAGRLDEMKGLIQLINAFQSVLKENSKVRLLIAGSGNYMSLLKESANIWNKITFTGKVEKETLYKFYQIADIGVIPSFTEQCSYSVIEMMMHGIPVIGTNSTGLGEMIEDGYNGYKVMLEETIEDINLPIENLSRSILSLLNLENKFLSQMKKQSREMYEKRYTLALMRQAMNSVYLL